MGGEGGRFGMVVVVVAEDEVTDVIITVVVGHSPASYIA